MEKFIFMVLCIAIKVIGTQAVACNHVVLVYCLTRNAKFEILIILKNLNEVHLILSNL